MEELYPILDRFIVPKLNSSEFQEKTTMFLLGLVVTIGKLKNMEWVRNQVDSKSLGVLNPYLFFEEENPSLQKKSTIPQDSIFSSPFGYEVDEEEELFGPNSDFEGKQQTSGILFPGYDDFLQKLHFRQRTNPSTFTWWEYDSGTVPKGLVLGLMEFLEEERLSFSRIPGQIDQIPVFSPPYHPYSYVLNSKKQAGQDQERTQLRLVESSVNELLDYRVHFGEIAKFRLHHKNKDFNFKYGCNLCQESFPSGFLLGLHRKYHERMKSLDQDGSICSGCGVFFPGDSLFTHVLNNPLHRIDPKTGEMLPLPKTKRMVEVENSLKVYRNKLQKKRRDKFFAQEQEKKRKIASLKRLKRLREMNSLWNRTSYSTSKGEKRGFLADKQVETIKQDFFSKNLGYNPERVPKYTKLVFDFENQMFKAL